MQNVLIEKPYRFVPRLKLAWPQSVYCRLGIYRRTLRRLQGVVKYECRNLELLKKSLDAGHGIVLTPNHPRTADPMVMCRVAHKTPCNFYAMASWHLFNQDWLSTWVIRLMGAFSVNREGLDRQAVDEAIEILQNAERPLLIFPEGTTSRTNDQLMSLMEGPAFIARTAAKRRAKKNGGKVVVHPIGIKYLFEGDIDKTCHPILTKIEQQQLNWTPNHDLPLVERLIQVGDGLLSQKESQYGISQPIGSHRERQTALINRLLHPLEQEWLGGQQDDGIAIRIKNLRMKIFPEMTRNELATNERKRRWKQLEETYLAQQIDCYPENYVVEHPTVDRILETVEKFEEDVTDQCTVHGDLKVIIRIDDPIEVQTERVRGVDEDPLMAQIRNRLSELLVELQKESIVYG
ncbi:MAG: 1-acyl-sn-glycerol-3-phosphate acyltransferase [Planctomycetota bacterium]